MKAILAAMICALLLLPSAHAQGADPTAREIMERNYLAPKVSSLRATSTMVLITESGQTRERRSENIVKLQPNGVDSNFLVRFTFPNDIEGTGYLLLEHAGGEDDQWIYLPALRRSRRLVANNKKDSFVGSDFSYGDISLPAVDLYIHTLLRSEVIDGHDCFVIESVPASDDVRANSGYSRKTTWVRKDSYLEAKVEYFDLSGRLLKTQTITEHQLVEPETGRWFALARTMVNHQTGHQTVLTFDRLEAGAAISDDLFSTRYLERE